MKVHYKGYDLVIFDLDGTLIDSSPDIILAAKHVLSMFGLPQRDDAFIEGCIGGGAKALVKKCAGDVKQGVLDAATAEFMRFYQQNCAIKSYLYPGVVDTLAKLKKGGITLAVATMKVRQATLKMLKDYQIDHFFSSVVTLDDVSKGKPDPECIHRILADLKHSREHTMIVGDSLADINAGKNAGVKTCAILYGFGAADKLAESNPDFLADAFDKLLDIVLSD